LGIFDKLRTKADVNLTPKAALALAAMTVIGADGSIEDDEISSLTRIVRGDENAFNSALTVYKDLSVTDSVQLVSKVLGEKQRIACIAILLDLAMADGVLVGAEQKLMDAYITAFQLSEQDISSIVDIIALKNDFSVFERSAGQAAGAFCQSCGTKLGAGMQFCSGCGTRV
jgi:uncharacterized tellurite resistance protein B-like protein